MNEPNKRMRNNSPNENETKIKQYSNLQNKNVPDLTDENFPKTSHSESSDPKFFNLIVEVIIETTK